MTSEMNNPEEVNAAINEFVPHVLLLLDVNQDPLAKEILAGFNSQEVSTDNCLRANQLLGALDTGLNNMIATTGSLVFTEAQSARRETFAALMVGLDDSLRILFNDRIDYDGIMRADIEIEYFHTVYSIVRTAVTVLNAL